MYEYIISPFKLELLSKIDNSKIIIRSSCFDEINNAISYFQTKEKKLYGIQYFSTNDNDSFQLECDEIPISIYDYTNLHNIKPQNNLRIFLSSSQENNYEKVKELSLMGFHSGIYFENPLDVKWNHLHDLLLFYLDNINKTSPIEPFHYTLNSYNRKRRFFQSFNTMYFDNPEHFFHLDKEGNIASNLLNLKQSNFFANIDDDPKYIATKIEEVHDKEYEYFLIRHECISCLSWTICKGNFKDMKNKNECKKLFRSLVNYMNQSINEKNQDKCKA